MSEKYTPAQLVEYFKTEHWTSSVIAERLFKESVKTDSNELAEISEAFREVADKTLEYGSAPRDVLKVLGYKWFQEIQQDCNELVKKFMPLN